MKKTMKHILALVIILPFIFAGCQKSELVKDSEEPINTGSLKSAIEYCGDTYVANLVDWDQTLTAGSLTVGNDEDYFYALFEVTSNYEILKSALYVGPISEAPGVSYNPTTSTGIFFFDQLTYYTEHNPAVASYLIAHDLSLLEECFDVIGILEIKDLTTGGIFRVSAKSNLKTHAFYFNYCKQECEPPPPLGECETAFAYGDQYAYCFRDFKKKNGQYNPGGSPNKNFSRWGWTNGELEEGNTYNFDIWAGAGQCDLSKGTLVGDLTVDYYGSTVTVTYSMMDGYVMDETHLYIGEDPIPMKSNNKPTLAPGQYTYSDGDATTVEDNLVTYEINNITGEIYVIAHSVVCDDE